MQEDDLEFNAEETCLNFEIIGYNSVESILSVVSDDEVLDNRLTSQTPYTPCAPETPFTPQTPFSPLTPYTPGSALSCSTPFPDENLPQDHKCQTQQLHHTSEDDNVNILLNELMSLNGMHNCHDKCPAYDNQMSVESLNAEDASLEDAAFLNLLPVSKRRRAETDEEEVVPPAKRARKDSRQNTWGFQTNAAHRLVPPGYPVLNNVDINGNDVRYLGLQDRNIPSCTVGNNREQLTSAAVRERRHAPRCASTPQRGEALPHFLETSNTSTSSPSPCDQTLNPSTYNNSPLSPQENIQPHLTHSFARQIDHHGVVIDGSVTSRNVAQPKSEPVSSIPISGGPLLQTTPDSSLVIQDPALKQAVKLAVELKSETPLIKYSLKQMILLKKNKKGEEIGDIDFTPKPKPQLTPEEIQRVEHRKQLNKKAAAKHREEKKKKKSKLEEEWNFLEQTNKQLLAQMKKLNDEKDYMISRLQSAGISLEKIHERLMFVQKDPVR